MLRGDRGRSEGEGRWGGRGVGGRAGRVLRMMGGTVEDGER